MDLEEIKEKYPDEWILVEVLEHDDRYQVNDAKLLAHSKDRDVTAQAMVENKEKFTFHFYNGDFPDDLVYML